MSLLEPNTMLQSLVVIIDEAGSTVPKSVRPGVPDPHAELSSEVALGMVMVTVTFELAAGTDGTHVTAIMTTSRTARRAGRELHHGLSV